MAELRITPVCLVATANINGVGTFSLKIPGTFAGFSSSNNVNGRYVRSLNLWTQDGTHGDRAHTVILRDDDGVIPAPARGAFANYPVIQELGDTAVGETGDVKRGVFLPPGEVVVLGSVDPNYYVFVPSGLYMKATFESANLLPSGKKCYCNLIWGTYS